MSITPQLDRSWRSPRSLMGLILGIAISALGVGLIARAIDPDQFARTFQTIQWSWIGLAIFLTFCVYGARLRRWDVLLLPLRFRPARELRALLSGQLINHLLPIRLGDLIRSILLGREPGGSVARVLGSVLIEKAWDWLALCALILIVTWAIPLPDWFLAPTRTIGLLAACVVIGFVGVALVPERWVAHRGATLDRVLTKFPARWHTFLLNNGQRLLDSLTVLRRRDTVAGAAGWTLITWLLSAAVNYAVQRAFGVDSWIAAATLLVVLMIGIALPPSIAALGIFEGLSILTLELFNVPLETALAIGLSLHLVVLLPLLSGTALTWLYTARQS